MKLTEKQAFDIINKTIKYFNLEKIIDKEEIAEYVMFDLINYEIKENE